MTAPISNNEREYLQALESELCRAKEELARLASQQGEAAESLRAAEEFKSRLVACSRDRIKVLDLEGRLLFMNEGGMQVLEICDIGPFLHNSWIDFWEGGDRDAARTAVQTARGEGVGRFVGYFEPLVRWETPRLCRGGSKSLTIPAVCFSFPNASCRHAAWSSWF